LRKNHLQLSIDNLSTALGEFGANPDTGGLTKDLHQRLQHFHQLASSTVGGVFTTKQAPSQWSQLFSQQLDILGWPGSRSLDTIEFQQLDIWQNVLLQLAGFDAVFASVTFSHAVELLKQLAFETQFQPQTGDSPVQILGLFEAAGMLFDYLWVMHLDSESWPQSINPNPLLPLQLQKVKQMPMSSIQRELVVAKKLTRRLQYSAPHVIFSHSARDGDAVLHPSPLIESLPVITVTQLPYRQAVNYWQAVFASSRLEFFVDDCALPLDDTKAICGGVQILKDQAACPFRAFATHRLRATPTVAAQPGLTAAERGNLVHNALDVIWRHLQSHAALIKLSDEELRCLIHHGVSRSFHILDASKIIGPKLKRLEIDRLCRLLHAWLQIEKQRAPFSVKSTETKGLLTLARLPIHVRYDRVDQLADGSLLVIDYKTVKSDIHDWTGLRPDEPQVPLYGIAHQHQVSAVAFGQIHVDQIAFKGISLYDNTILGLQTPAMLGHLELPDTWPEILDHWRQVLTRLAEEFVAGFADVKPKYGTSSCHYCSLHSLCRIKQDSAIKQGVGEKIVVEIVC
jgi:ATP-dependent helicase/nuclease subunit B